MPPQKRDWYRQYAVFYKDSPAMIEALERLIVEVMNENNLSRSDAVRMIFDAGIKVMSQDPTYGSVQLRMSVAESRLFHAATLEAQRQQARVEIYQLLGPLGILGLAQELGIEKDAVDAVLESCKRAILPGRNVSPSQAYRAWIKTVLSDGDAHKHDEVIQQAIDDGLLPDQTQDPDAFDKALSTFRQVASSLGVSGGKRGWWQLPSWSDDDDDGPF